MEEVGLSCKSQMEQDFTQCLFTFSSTFSFLLSFHLLQNLCDTTSMFRLWRLFQNWSWHNPKANLVRFQQLFFYQKWWIYGSRMMSIWINLSALSLKWNQVKMTVKNCFVSFNNSLCKKSISTYPAFLNSCHSSLEKVLDRDQRKKSCYQKTSLLVTNF